MEFDFAGPPGYVGIPGENGGNHLFLIAATAAVPTGGPLSLRPPCYSSGAQAERTTIGGRRATWISCPGSAAESGVNSGHIILMWSIGAVRYAVSVHTDSPVNRRLERRFATSLAYVEPKKAVAWVNSDD
jgi:hypothetical protein